MIEFLLGGYNMRKTYDINSNDKEVDRMMGWQSRGIVSFLTNNPFYQANPEFAFGVVRKLVAKNKLRQKDVLKFLTGHPVFSQILNLEAMHGQLLFDAKIAGVLSEKKVDGKIEQYREYVISYAWENSGTATVTWESPNGTKTEQIQLGFEMLMRGGNALDKRPFLALNMGGSQVRYRLLKTTDQKPNIKKSNDKTAFRTVVKQKRAMEEPSYVRSGATDGWLIEPTQRNTSLMDRLMSGETFTNL
jgi:hypothetical protein